MACTQAQPLYGRTPILEKGAAVFSQNDIVAEYWLRIAAMERLLGKKELETAVLGKFLGRAR